MRCGVTRSEWAWALAVSSLVLLMSCIPSLTGYAVQTPEWVFGGAVFDRPDYNVHLASIQSGLRGEWQYPMLHTSENARPANVKLFYIVVGQIDRWLPLAAPALYQGARLVCGLWMLLTRYVFAACFLWPVVLRRTAFLLLVFGSGLGWLMLLLSRGMNQWLCLTIPLRTILFILLLVELARAINIETGSTCHPIGLAH